MNLHDGAVDMFANDDYAKPKRPPKADVGVYPAEAARQSDDQEGRAALWKPRRDYEAMDMARYLLFTRMPVRPLPGWQAALTHYIGSQLACRGLREPGCTLLSKENMHGWPACPNWKAGTPAEILLLHGREHWLFHLCCMPNPVVWRVRRRRGCSWRRATTIRT